MNDKAPDAFRTISEVAEWLGVNTHVLRFWESKFSQVKPVKRAGGRRYYRPADMELLGGIQKLLHDDGMTIKGVQKILREQGARAVAALSKPINGEGATAPAEAAETPAEPTPAHLASATLSLVAGPQRGAAAPKPGAQGRVAVGTSPRPADAAPASKPKTEEPMPLFAHHADTRAPANPGPKIAPLPDRNLPLAEAVAQLAPYQVDVARLKPILGGLRALRDRLDADG